MASACCDPPHALLSRDLLSALRVEPAGQALAKGPRSPTSGRFLRPFPPETGKGAASARPPELRRA